MSKDQAKAPKAGKGKDKKARAAKGDASDRDGAIRIQAHPQARRAIRRTRAWAGMAGFALVLLLASRAGVPLFDAVLRGLAGGVVLHFMAWGFAIVLWRRLIVAELEAVRARLGESPASRVT